MTRVGNLICQQEVTILLQMLYEWIRAEQCAENPFNFVLNPRSLYESEASKLMPGCSLQDSAPLE